MFFANSFNKPKIYPLYDELKSRSLALSYLKKRSGYLSRCSTSRWGWEWENPVEKFMAEK